MVAGLEEEIKQVATEQTATCSGEQEPVLQKGKKVEQEGDFFAAVTVTKNMRNKTMKRLKRDGNLLSDGIGSFKRRRQQLELFNHNIGFVCAMLRDNTLHVAQANESVDSDTGDGAVGLSLDRLAGVEHGCRQHGEQDVLAPSRMGHMAAVADELPALVTAPYVVHVHNIHFREAVGVSACDCNTLVAVPKRDFRCASFVYHSQLLAGAVKPAMQ